MFEHLFRKKQNKNDNNRIEELERQIKELTNKLKEKNKDSENSCDDDKKNKLSKINPGDKFGEWTVISKSKTKKYCHLCKCSCGKHVDVDSYNLKSGKSKSCRPCAHTIISSKINIQKPSTVFSIGTKFGKWTVIEDSRNSKNGYKVKCRCICGIERMLSPFDLKHKRTTSCSNCRNKRLTIKGDECTTSHQNNIEKTCKLNINQNLLTESTNKIIETEKILQESKLFIPFHKEITPAHKLLWAKHTDLTYRLLLTSTSENNITPMPAIDCNVCTKLIISKHAEQFIKDFESFINNYLEKL